MIQYIKHLYAVLLFVLMVQVIWGQDTVTDIDGNVYETIQIGNQLWMKENLKTTHYRNGDEIPNITNEAVWSDLSTGAYCDYDDNPSNSETYGRLYNWYTVDDDREICPENWHIPLDYEWSSLTNYLGGSEIEGGKMKETGTEHWNSPNIGATNESGFTALPAGSRYSLGGNYTSRGNTGYFWSSTVNNINNFAWNRELYYNYSAIPRYDYPKQYGFSVRCLQNSPETILIPQDYPTIQAGIDAAFDGDTVLVSAGTYLGDISINGKLIILMSLEGPDSTFLERVLAISGEPLGTTLRGFSFINAFRPIAISSSNLLIDNCILVNCEQEVVHCDGNGYGTVTNTLINGGRFGLKLGSNDGGSMIVINSTITNVTDAAITISHGSNIEITNLILADNGGDLHWWTGEPNSISINYTAIDGYPFEEGEFNCGGDDYCSGSNNISNNPLFTDPENDDYTLQPTSPCIDAGDPSSPLDPDSTIADMGAYYFHQVPGCTDSTAINYNPEANWDDGSCVYPDNGDYSLHFDGFDDYVNCGQSEIISFGTGDLTHSIFIKLNELGGSTQQVMWNGYNPELQIEPDGKVFVYFQAGGCGVIASDSNITINQWYHIILKREDGQGSLYIDGILEGTSDASNCICNSSENLLFGIQWPEPFGGYIRDATFWNYALSENEFNMLSSNLSGYESGLIGYWRFNEGVGNTVYDYSGNQNHGTIYGATWNMDEAAVISDEIPLSSGWNLMSFDIDIENNAPEEVFALQIANNNLLAVTGYNNGALFFDPTLPPFLNSLTAINAGYGYWVKLNNEDAVSNSGIPLSIEYTINLSVGWNLISYWLQESQAPVDAFLSLINNENLITITGFDSGALLFDPALPPFLNSLTSLNNGFGYWVKLNQAVDDFHYPEATTVLARTTLVTRKTNPNITKTNVFMFVNGSVAFDHVDYTVGDMVNITTESGLLVGEMEILENGYLMTGPIYGDDFTTEELDGALKDEALIFSYNEYTSEPIDISFHGNMELSRVDLTFKNVPHTFSLHQNYPNPFNPITSLRYDLPEQSQITLTIYNMLGREVTQLINTTQEAGFKSVQWNATDMYGKPVSAGVYLYQIQAGEFVQTKKMVLLK